MNDKDYDHAAGPQKADAVPVTTDHADGLPATFPQDCLGPVIAALRGEIGDARQVAVCAYRLAGWALSLWVGQGGASALPEAAAQADAVGVTARHKPREWAAKQLETLQPGGGETPDGAQSAPMVLPWKTIAAIILDLLKDALNKV
jgi:hypothetical protein